METRPLADTGLDLSVLSFGASSMGAEFRRIDVGEALQCVKVALDRGMKASRARDGQVLGARGRELRVTSW